MEKQKMATQTNNQLAIDNIQPISRSQKMLNSRKITSSLTVWVINYLNDSGQFHVHRSNNIASPIIKREMAYIDAFDENGNPKKFPYEKITTMFKKGNIKETILDISGFVLPYNNNDEWAGKHIELEVKTGKDSLSDEQIKRIENICDAGGISFAFNSKEMFLYRIKPYMVERKLAF